MKAKTAKRIVFVIIYVLLIGLLDYPYVARIFNNYIQGSVITDYDSSIPSESDVKIMMRAAENYNKLLSSGTSQDKLMDAFSVDSAIDDGESELYKKMLNFNDSGIMGTIQIPKIDVTLPIYHGTAETELQKGAGHLQGSSLPIGGTGTHSIISAHRGLKGKTMFTNLDLVEKGDIFFIDVLNQKIAYQVYDIETVLPTNVSSLTIEPDKDLCTLVTCTPYGINNHRLLVHGKRIEMTKEIESLTLPDTEVLIKEYWWIPATILFVIAMFFSIRKIQ